jgi:hypothetical protein
MHCTFGVPTSAKVATACLFKEERVTWSKSISRILDTPDLARAAVACDPTPPQPATIINDERSFANPSSLKNTRLRASCSRARSIQEMSKLAKVMKIKGLLSHLHHNHPAAISEQGRHFAHLRYS